MQKTVYLAGAINGCTDAEASDWRKLARTMIEVFGGSVVDPMSRDYRGRELDLGVTREIVEGDKADIDRCTDLLVYVERPSWGTAMEILYAWERGIRVTIVDRSQTPLSPWVMYHSANRWPAPASGAPPQQPRVFRSMTEAVAEVMDRTLPKLHLFGIAQCGTTLQCPVCGDETSCAKMNKSETAPGKVCYFPNCVCADERVCFGHPSAKLEPVQS